jgi:threonine/homoserine/homoserine lactone efflux protein
MELSIFFKGICIGFALAVPIGPIGILCIHKTISEGRLSGLIIGLGAATADLIYGIVAAFGLTFISNTLYNQRIWIRLAGGILFLLLGLKIFRKHTANSITNISSERVFRSYLSTVFLTLTNPLTIFAFIAVFAALGLGKRIGYFSISALVAGVFIGSCIWFLSLNSGVALFRKKINFAGLQWVNRIAGILIIISGVIAIASLF